MLTYALDQRGDLSLYEYLYRCIRDDILSGKIAEGEKMPSKRAFAKNLGVSTITVESAYAQLSAEGYLRAVPRSGYYAASIGSAGPVMRDPGAGEGTVPGTGREKRGEAAGRTAQAGAAASEAAPPAIDLASGRPGPELFPFALWARLMREVLSLRQEELMAGMPGIGALPLREALARYLLEYQGMRTDPDQIVIGAGTEYLYGMLILLLGQERLYALEDPGYRKISMVYGSHGIKTAYIPVREDGVDIGALRLSGADILHISPSHQFPTGVTTPIGRRRELLAWAQEKEERYIIEDDYDGEFRLSGRPIPSLWSIDRADRVIYMNTFTKSLASTIRISYMVLPAPLAARLRENLWFYACTVSAFEQYTLAAFIERGYFDKHINRMRNEYRQRRDVLLEALRRELPRNKVRVHNENAGLHFLLEVETQMSEEEMTRRAAAEGVRILGLSAYLHGYGAEPGSRVMVVNYSGLGDAQCREAAKALRRAWMPGE